MQVIEPAPAQEFTSSDRNSNGSYPPDNTPPAVRARNAVSSIRKLSPGAKWFFGWLTDATYSFNLGGDGHGRVAITQKKIRRLTGHDRKSLSRWTSELVDIRVLWVEPLAIENAYPANVYCIRELVPGQREANVADLAGTWGRLRGDRGKFAARPESDQDAEKDPLFSAENQDAASQGGKMPPPKGANSRLAGGNNGTGQEEKCRLAGGENGTSEAAEIPTAGGKNGTGEAAFFRNVRPKNAAWEGAETDHLKETPKEKGRTGATECVPAPATHQGIPQFEPLDLKCAPRLRTGIGEKMIDLCKEKIYATEFKNPPPPNGREIIAAYKKRIRDVKKWIAGEL